MLEPRITTALAIAERLIRDCVPDLDGQPLYLLQPSPGTMLTRDTISWRAGCFFGNLDQAFRPMLEAEGRWRGPGVALIVDAELLFAVQRNDDDGLRATIGMTLHEVAHWLDRPTTEAPANAYQAFRTARQQDAPQAENEPPRQFSDALLWHGDSFIRICAHLWYRAGHGGGLPLRPESICFGSSYPSLEFLHRPLQYIEALEPEFDEYRQLPLREIAALPEPRAFTDLWDEVLAREFVTQAA